MTSTAPLAGVALRIDSLVRDGTHQGEAGRAIHSMACRYGLPIRVQRDKGGAPRPVLWRGEMYRIQEVLSTWRLCDRWWVSPLSVALGHASRGPSDRRYYRLLLPGHQMFEMYHDTVSNLWVLDVA